MTDSAARGKLRTLLLPLALAACAAEPSGSGESLEFVEVQADAGLDFRHEHGGTGKRYMIETMGSGGGFLDYDGDG